MLDRDTHGPRGASVPGSRLEAVIGRSRCDEGAMPSEPATASGYCLEADARQSRYRFQDLPKIRPGVPRLGILGKVGSSSGLRNAV